MSAFYQSVAEAAPFSWLAVAGMGVALASCLVALLLRTAFLRNAPSESALLHFEDREKSRMKEALGSLERLGGVRRAKPRQFTSP